MNNSQNLINMKEVADMCKFAPVLSVGALVLAILAIQFAPMMLILVVAIVTLADIVITFGSKLSWPTMLFHTICAIGTALYVTYEGKWGGWVDSYVSEYDHQYYADEYTSTLWLVLYCIFAIRCAAQLANIIVIHVITMIGTYFKRKGA